MAITIDNTYIQLFKRTTTCFYHLFSWLGYCMSKLQSCYGHVITVVAMLVSVCYPKDSDRLKLPDKMAAKVLVGQRYILSDSLIMACQSNLGSTLMRAGLCVCGRQAFSRGTSPLSALEHCGHGGLH